MKIGIGTAQFGLNYGVSNQQGKTSPLEVKNILNLALDHDICVLDTAPAYGESEDVLGKILPPGNSLKIITKTPVLNKSIINREDRKLIRETFYQSLKKLNQSSIDGLLVHQVQDILAEGGEYLFEEMLQLKQKNLIRKIGVSVYNADQIDQVLSRYSIDLIQLPINIFDQRLLKNGYLEKLHNLGIEIHARSLFLQGLLLMNLEELPPYFTPYRTCLETYYKTLDKNGISPLKSALDFIQNISQVNCIIVGINTAEQLQEILGTFNETERLNSDFFESFSIENELIINPSNWVI